MMRVIQKLDKFDTNNQKIGQISKCDSSHKKSGHRLGVKFCLIFLGSI
jgi:hypothetical protein